MKFQKQISLLSLFLFMFILSSCVQNLPLNGSMFNTNNEEAWVQSLVGKSSAEQSKMAADVWADSSKPLKLRDRATYILASRSNPSTKIAQQSLNSQYSQSANEYKIYMEETLFHDLNTAPDADITANLKLISPSLEAYFPYNLTIFAAAKRGLLENSQEVLDKFASQNYFQSSKITVGNTPSTNYATASDGSIAMLLPQNGSYSTFSRQIITGAKIAQKLLLEQGIQWNITFIDTQDPNWISYLENLPKSCSVIGGPLQTNIYKTLYNSKLTSQRAFFAFLTRLPDPSVEGLDAWRFFTSPEDQVKAVINVAQNDLGVTNFGSFHQDNTYGNGMNNLFTKIAQERGLSVYSTSYSDKETKDFNTITKNFLNATTPAKGKMPIARRPMDAIFLPDVWKKMDMIISYMHYHGGHKKIMLGTSLWEQSLSNPINMNPQTFALTLFPVSYDSKRESPYRDFFQAELTKQQSMGTSWIALGFDFVMMSSRLQMGEKRSSEEINRRLANLKVDYIGAPFLYARDGKLSRELIINQPARNGRTPYDKETFLLYQKDGKVLPNLDDAAKDKITKEQEESALDALVHSIVN